MGNVVIAGTASGATSLPVASTIDGLNDFIPIYTASATATQAINRRVFLGVTGQPADISSTQTISNKVIGNSNLITALDGGFTLQNNVDTTKRAVFSLSGITTATTRTYTLPNASSTLADIATTQTLTNKTLTSPIVNAPTITNATITQDSVVGFTTSTTGTVYGISVTTGAISSALSLGSTLAVTGATTLTGALQANSTITSSGQLSVQTTTAPPAAGANTSGIKFSSTANLGFFWGSGAPTFSAAQGSFYLNTTGSSGSTRAYINSTGSTTWVAVTTAS